MRDPTSTKQLRLFRSSPTRLSGGSLDNCLAFEVGEVDLSPSHVESSSLIDSSALVSPPLPSASRVILIAPRVIVPRSSPCPTKLELLVFLRIWHSPESRNNQQVWRASCIPVITQPRPRSVLMCFSPAGPGFALGLWFKIFFMKCVLYYIGIKEVFVEENCRAR